jgi:hypothetical protein
MVQSCLVESYTGLNDRHQASDHERRLFDRCRDVQHLVTTTLLLEAANHTHQTLKTLPQVNRETSRASLQQPQNQPPGWRVANQSAQFSL